MSGKEILNNPAFKAAFESIENDLVKSMRNVGMNDRDTHQSIILSVQLLGRIEKHFEKLLNNDKVAEFKVEQRSKRA